jgi:anti-sigma regulatory factor (Ser/Thr protein kinase)
LTTPGTDEAVAGSGREPEAGSGVSVERLRGQFVAELQAVRAARQLAYGLLAGDLDEESCWRVSLLVDELVANAVMHGSERPTDPVALRLWTSPAKVRAEVSDSGAGFELPKSESQTGPPRGGGMGLVLVDQLASRWGISESSKTRVWFEVDRQAGLAPDGRRSPALAEPLGAPGSTTRCAPPADPR